VNLGAFLAVGVLLQAAQDPKPPDLFQERKLATIPDDVPLPPRGECVSVSPGGKRVVWFYAVPPKQSVVVLDGVPCKPIEGYGTLFTSNSSTPVLHGWSYLPGALWSIDGKHVAWHGVRESKRFLIVDGVENESVGMIQTLNFSADWSRIAYAAEEGKKSFAVLDGKKYGTEYEKVTSVSLSADGRRFGYQVWHGNKWFVVADGRAVEGNYRWSQNLQFSPDGARMAFVGFSDKGQHVVLDGVESPPYSNVREMMFSPDGRRLAVEVRIGARSHVVIDGVPGPPFEEIEGRAMTFSPDGKRFAYVADHNLVVDGQAQPVKVPLISGLTFSPDGKRLGYFRQMDLGGYQVVVDGTVYTVGTEPLVFSPNGRHFACVHRGRQVVVDRTPGPEFDAVVSPPVFSPDDKKVGYAVRRGRDILWKVDDIVEELGAGAPPALEQFGKVRSVLENSESYRLRSALQSTREDRPADPPTRYRLSLQAKGNRVKLVYDDAATGSALELVSDGTTVEMSQIDGTGKIKPFRAAQPATEDYREGLSQVLAYGVPLEFWIMGSKKITRVVDVKALEPTDGKNGLSYTFLLGDTGAVGRAQVWYDPKTFVMSKRIVKVDSRMGKQTVTETFEELTVNPAIPDTEFRVSEKK